MANVWFCSDLHFGHKNIQKYRKEISSEEHNRSVIKFEWNALVTKRDTVYVLGDACFTMDTIADFGELKGKKYLIRGNHDLLNTSVYLKYFEEVYGLLKYKEFWLSHAPIHPDELRGKRNLHGHTHYHRVGTPFNPVYDVKQGEDTRYLNCCVENLNRIKGESLICLEDVRKYFKNLPGT
jgi:calcineurin-like phosphoesterase family protein